MNKNRRQIVKPTIIKENESVARRAYEQGDFVLCFLLTHSLIESLLRTSLEQTEKVSFHDLIKAYENFMKLTGQMDSVFVDELIKFNQRRNRVVHQLWENGYSATNEKLEITCQYTFIMYGLLIEWLETFDSEITECGFDYDKE